MKSTSVWKAVALERPPTLRPRVGPPHGDVASLYPLRDFDLVLPSGESLKMPCASGGWYAGLLHGQAAVLSDLDAVTWAMPIGVRTAGVLDPKERAYTVLEGAWHFHTSQILLADGIYAVQSEEEGEHVGGVILDPATRPRVQDGPLRDFPSRELAWMLTQARLHAVETDPRTVGYLRAILLGPTPHA